jgi:hypothetical protein
MLAQGLGKDVRVGGKASGWIVRLAAVAAMAACLPDLDPLPPEPPPPTVPPCGDGVLGPDEECDPGDKPVKGCVDCKIVCEGKKDDRTGHCYFAAQPQPRDPGFIPAFQACSAADAHIVTIASDEELSIVESLVPPDSRYWIGLTFPSTTSAYTTGAAVVSLGLETGWPVPPCRGPCTGCYGFGLPGGGIVLPDGGVQPPRPDAGPGDCQAPDLQCVIANTSQRHWQQAGCLDPGIPVMTVCEREPPGTAIQNCGSIPCFTLRGGDKLYSIHTEQVADAVCESGARLLHLGSEDERVDLVRALSEIQTISFDDSPTFSIGLSWKNTAWVWDDGSPLDPTLHVWGDRQPAVDAAGRAYLRLSREYDSGLVYADTSPGSRGFLCERKP